LSVLRKTKLVFLLIYNRLKNYFFLAGQDEIPKTKYNGQKLMKLVSVNTAASIIRTMPNVPLTTFVK